MNGMFEIGCEECGEGGEWSLFTDGHGNFRAKHKCGHISGLIIRGLIQ